MVKYFNFCTDHGGFTCDFCTRFGQVIWGFPSRNPQLPRQVLEKQKTAKKNLILVHLEIFRVDYSYLNID